MKIINWLKSRSGKFALSAAQAIGAAAAVGVAGIAAYQMFSSPEVNPDTVFSSQDNDVVYVAGANGGAYNGVGYGEGGEMQSSIRVSKSRSMELMEQDELRMKEKPQTQLDRDEQEIKAFAMDGKTEGLGMGKNELHEFHNDGQGDMSGVQAQIAAISAMAEQKKAEAEGKAKEEGEGGDIARAAQAALKQSGKGWGNMNSNIARASGNNLNSESLQAGGPGSKRGGTLGGANGKEADRIAMADRAKLGKTSGFDASRDEMMKARRRYSGGDDLGAMAKYSASLADQKNRTDNEATSIFMSSGGGGVHELKLGETAVSSLGEAESAAFGGLTKPSMNGGDSEGETYGEAQARLIDRVQGFRDACIGVAMLSLVPPLNWIVYGFMAIEENKILKEVDEFNATWGETVMETENTQGSFGEHLSDATVDIYRALWAGGYAPIVGAITGPIAIWQTYEGYKEQYWADAEEEEEEE